MVKSFSSFNLNQTLTKHEYKDPYKLEYLFQVNSKNVKNHQC